VILGLQDVTDLSVAFLINHGLDNALYFIVPAEPQLNAQPFQKLLAGTRNIARSATCPVLLPITGRLPPKARKTSVDRNQGTDPVGKSGGQVKRHVGSPGVPQHRGFLKPKMVHQAHRI
jgi:hypothetical protein